MEFGNVPPEELPSIDFTLPSDPDMTTTTLKSSNRLGELKVHVGCTKWVQKPWIGYVYPVDIKDVNFMPEYAKQFNTIEFGPTFYSQYNADSIRQQWTSKIDDTSGFKFCPKMWQRITHFNRLKNTESETKKFFDSLSGFDDHLGPILMQVGDPFTPKYADVLSDFLPLIPNGFQVFTEVRNKDWFANTEDRAKLFDILQKQSVGAVITDAPGRRDCVHMQLPTPHAFIRFVGNNGSLLEKTRLDAWVERIKQWSDLGLQSLWFFMHQHDELYAPFSCRYFIRKLNEKLGLNISEPMMYDELKADHELKKKFLL